MIDSTTVLTDPKQMKLKNGILELDRKSMEFPNIVARDVIVRAQVRKLSGQNLAIQLRHTKGVGYYEGWYNGGDDFGIGKRGKQPFANLQAGRIGREFKPDDFVEMTVSVVGDLFALYVEGRQVYSFQDKEQDRGMVSFHAFNGKSLFKDVEYQILDADTPTSPNAPSTNTATAKGPVSVPSVTKIPADAKSFNNHSYKFYPEKLTWKKAKAKCETLGGNLVIIDSAEENKFVADLLEKAAWRETWIGITDEAKEGQWLTVTGQSATFTNWGNWGQPEPCNSGGREHYARLSNRGLQQQRIDPRWTDQQDTADWEFEPGYVCEWSSPPATNSSQSASPITPAPQPLPPAKHVRTLAAGYCMDARVTPDEKFMATVDLGGEVKWWKADMGELIRSLGKHGSRVDELALSANGQLAATGGFDRGEVKIWDVANSGDSLITFPGNGKWGVDLEGTSDGRHLIVRVGSAVRLYRITIIPLTAGSKKVAAKTGLPKDVAAKSLVARVTASFGDVAFH